jgi:hypothetical protein
VPKHARVLITVMNCIVLSAFVGACIADTFKPEQNHNKATITNFVLILISLLTQLSLLAPFHK